MAEGRGDLGTRAKQRRPMVVNLRGQPSDPKKPNSCLPNRSPLCVQALSQI